MSYFKNSPPRSATWRALCCLALALLTGACAAMSRQPDAGRPRPNEPPYPLILGASEDRRERALAAWATLTSEQGVERAPAPELQPVTATLRALPTATSSNAWLRLPQVGGEGGKEQSEEELREALRRFIASARPVLGVAPEDLSLVERADNPDGTKRARYRQNPFSYPLRGDYGALDITFTADRRVVGLSSTAIPDVERLRRALSTVKPQLAQKDVAARLSGRTVTFNDAAGTTQTFTFNATPEISVRELVIYPTRTADDPSSLALHLAWEVAAGSDPQTTVVYIDAVTGDTLASERQK
jgi:hypothetical protein